MSIISILRYGVPLVVYTIVAISIHNIRVDSLRLSWEKELASAVEAESQKCLKEKVYAKDSNRKLQDRLNSIGDAYVRLLKAGGHVPVTDNTGGNDDAAGANEFALSAEQRRLNDVQAAQLVSCQDLVTHIYQVNHQEWLLPSE